MTGLILRSIAIGVAGLVAVPILTFIVVLGFAHLVDGRCGTPGDSGGCEMGSFAAAIAMALPGFAIGFFVSLIPGLRRLRADGKTG